MWVRFHKCYSALIRASLRKLQSRSFSFCCSFCAGSSGRRPAGQPQVSLLPSDEDSIFLQLRNKTVYVTEPQVSCWNDLANNASSVIHNYFHMKMGDPFNMKRLINIMMIGL